MRKHSDFAKIYGRFIEQFGNGKGEGLYFLWLLRGCLSLRCDHDGARLRAVRSQPLGSYFH